MDDLLKIGLTGLVSAVVALLASVTNFSSKRREIKLSNYYKDRIDALKVLYSLIVELKHANNTIFINDTTDWGHHAYKAGLLRWSKCYSEVYNHYSRNRILLLEDNKLSNKVRDNFNQLRILSKAITAEQIILQTIEENTQDQLYLYYSDVSGNEQNDEQDEIQKRISIMSQDSELAYIINSFEVVRTDMEKYFKTLVE